MIKDDPIKIHYDYERGEIEFLRFHMLSIGVKKYCWVPENIDLDKISCDIRIVRLRWTSLQ